MVSIPRLPLVPDPLRRVRIPGDLDSITTRGPEEPAQAGGASEENVDRIWRSALDLYRTGVHPAVQICLRREGVVILDRAIGHARGNGPRDDPEAPKVAATPETPFVIYSGAKAITAFVAHLLAEQGYFSLEDPVSAYIPGYDRHGKGEITIGHVLAHRAGIPNLPRAALDLAHVGDREHLREFLCDARPFARPGRFLAYHAVAGGFILGEVVERVTGRTIREVLAEQVLDPLGFRWTNYGVAAEDVDEVALNYVTGPPAAPPLSNLLTRALGLPFDELVESSNDPRFLAGIVPAANTVTTAFEMTRLGELMRRGGELDGVRVTKPATIRHALTEQSHLEIDLSLGFPTRFSYGFMLGARTLSLFGRDTQHAFGHLGFTNILSWTDPERAISVSVITNGKPTLYPGIHRFYGLMQRITSEMPKADVASFAF
jgi:CubicO group peptidase (beta-lactamase class C family)